MDTFSASVDSPHTEPVFLTSDVSLKISLNKSLNKQIQIHEIVDC